MEECIQIVNWVRISTPFEAKLTTSARNREIDSGELREGAPETNCFAPFWEMGEGSAGDILWLQQVLDVSQLLPSPLRSVSASLVLGLHARSSRTLQCWPSPKIAFRLSSEAGAHAQLAHAVVKRIDSSPRGDTPSFSPDSALF